MHSVLTAPLAILVKLKAVGVVLLVLLGLSLIHIDAADDLLCVDLGGRRITKKKKKQQEHLQPLQMQKIRN